MSAKVGNLNCSDDVGCSGQGQDRTEATPTAPALMMVRREAQGMRPWPRPGRTRTQVNDFWRLSQALQGRRGTSAGPITRRPCAGSPGPCNLQGSHHHAHCTGRRAGVDVPFASCISRARRPNQGVRPLICPGCRVRALFPPCTPSTPSAAGVRAWCEPFGYQPTQHAARCDSAAPPGRRAPSRRAGLWRSGSEDLACRRGMGYAESRPLEESQQTAVNRAC
jgi:hypothetical protein